MSVIYFNQWFSSIANVIEDIKKDKNIRVIASSKNANHAYKYSADKFIVEDWEERGIPYINWVLDICIKNEVNIFFVKKHMLLVSMHRDLFKYNNIELICEDYNTLLEFESKANIYENIKKNNNLSWLVPDYYKGCSKKQAAEFVEADKKLCLKLDNDEGGASFRKIENTRNVSFNSLKSFRVNTITLDETIKMIEGLSLDELKQILFMDLLDSPEISVDCYNSTKGFIAICREKLSGTRVQRIYNDDKIYDLCKQLYEQFNLKYPFNVQFRIKNGADKNDINNLRLLEINTRISGGIYYETLLKLNIAKVVYYDIMGEQYKYSIDDYSNFKETNITHVEKGIILD